MDSLINAAARALAGGDTLGALQCVALRDDPPALALRGIAMAQLSEYPRARQLLRSAARRFGEDEALARARCVVAEAEVALAMRDLRGSPGALTAARKTLESHADHANAQHAQLIALRRLLLLGQLQECATTLSDIDTDRLPPPLLTVAELVTAELALRSLHTATATAALVRAHAAAAAAGIAALSAEVGIAATALTRPAARCMRGGEESLLRLHEVEALLSSGVLVVDACRRGLHAGAEYRSLARRPLLFALARALAQAWPDDVPRQTLITKVFRTRHADESHRARLRVEIARLRAAIAPLAAVTATPHGYAITARDQREIVVLLPPIEGAQASVSALLADGQAWSTSALALALGISQRQVQRALLALEPAGEVRAVGRARSQRWLAATLSGFTTNLLLPGTATRD